MSTWVTLKNVSFPVSRLVEMEIVDDADHSATLIVTLLRQQKTITFSYGSMKTAELAQQQLFSVMKMMTFPPP